MRARHRLEFDLFLKRRKARLATQAALAAAAEEAAAAQHSHHHHSPGQSQYYTLPHPGSAGATHLMGYGAAVPGTANRTTAFLPTAAAIGLHMQQQHQLQQQMAAAVAASRAAAAYGSHHTQQSGGGGSSSAEHLQQQFPQYHQPGTSLGHGFSLPLNTSNFQHHLQNMKVMRGTEGQGSSLTPSPTGSPTPAFPPAVSPIPSNGEGQQHSTNWSSSGTITAAPSISGTSQLSAQSPEFSVSGSMKGGQGSTPETPTRAPLMPHPQMGIPAHFESPYGLSAGVHSPYATIRAPSVYCQPGAPGGMAPAGAYQNPYHPAAPGYYFSPGYIG